MSQLDIKYKTSDDRIRYLSSGKQTLITPEILHLSIGIKGYIGDKVKKILELVNSLEVRGFDSHLFRKRTGAQIIQDKFVTGCTDYALAFITLSRASGIPTKYIETVDKEWLKEGGKSISGHIYAQIYDEDKNSWIWIDPMGNRADIPPPTDRVIYKEGLDSWDIGVNNFDTLNQQFQDFRKNWLEE